MQFCTSPIINIKSFTIPQNPCKEIIVHLRLCYYIGQTSHTSIFYLQKLLLSLLKRENEFDSIRSENNGMIEFMLSVPISVNVIHIISFLYFSQVFICTFSEKDAYV